MMEIRLAGTPGPGLEAVLHNGTTAEVRLVHDPGVQPSELVLTNSAGRRITPFDQRTIEKTDRTVYKGMFAAIAAGGELTLDRAVFGKQPQGGYQIVWGPYHYTDLVPGVWRARVVFDSRLDTARRRDTGASMPMPSVWKGRLTSNEVEIRLP